MTAPSEPTGSTPALPAAGWYPDPAGGGAQRYWDGAAWTEHVAPGATAAAPAVPAPAADPAVPTAEPAAFPGAPSVPVVPAYSSYAPQPVAPPYAGPMVEPRRVGFGDAIRRAFAGWSDYSSRATLAEYWWFVLFELIVGTILYIVLIVAFFSSLNLTTTTQADGTVVATSNGVSPLGWVALVLIIAVYLVFLVVSIALTVRRLHDSDRSGWWYLLVFVPFGSLVVLIFTILPGTPGPNRYGPVPQ